MELAPLVVRSADLVRSGVDDRWLRRAAQRGEMTLVAPGAYLPAQLWADLSCRDRFITRIHASASRLSGPVVLSHWSAAAVWNLPVPDEWPRAVEVIDPRTTSSTVRRTLVRRPGELAEGDVVPWQGLAVTGAARTASDIALASPFEHAVLVFDHGLRVELFTRDEVREQLARRPKALRRRSGVKALDFANASAEYAGESFSRCAMASRGILLPTLQEPFRDAVGLIGVADFWWAGVGVVGEFDGDWKYSDGRWLRGRTAAQAVADEKRRQNRLDAHPQVRRVVRWDYAVARNPDELARRLVAAGVPRLDGMGRAPRCA